MSIRYGTVDPLGVKYGSTSVLKMYYGSTLVWEPPATDVTDWYAAYDTKDLTKFFQNMAGTTAGALNSPVGTWKGKPNNVGVARDFIATADTTVRPTLATDASTGRTAVSFVHTSSQRLKHTVSPAVAAGGTLTVVMKFRLTIADATSRRYFDACNNTASSFQIHRSGSGNRVLVETNNSTTAEAQSPVGLQNTTDTVTLFASYTAGSIKLRWCVGTTFSATVYTGTGTPLVMNTYNGLFLGVNGSLAQPAGYNVEALRVYTRILTDTEQQTVFTAL